MKMVLKMLYKDLNLFNNNRSIRMKRTLTEQEVLNKLNIPSFSFASMIIEMEPEVAKKALDRSFQSSQK